MIKRLLLISVISINTIGLIVINDRLLGIFLKSRPQVLGANSTATYVTPEFNFHVTLNSLGFRGREYPFAKAQGTVRILVVGDSFTYGWGVSDGEVWVTLLEKYLNNRNSGVKYEVINLGVPGAAPYDYLETVKKYVPLYLPDYVFVALVEGNDFSLAAEIPVNNKSSVSEQTERKKQQLLNVLN